MSQAPGRLAGSRAPSQSRGPLLTRVLCWARPSSPPVSGKCALSLSTLARSHQPQLFTCQALRGICWDAIPWMRVESWSRDSWLAGWHQKPCRREVLALGRKGTGGEG